MGLRSKAIKLGNSYCKYGARAPDYSRLARVCEARFGFGRNRACAMTYSIVWLAVERQSLLREDLFCNIECKYVESNLCSMLSRQIYLKMVDNERMRSCFHLV